MDGEYSYLDWKLFVCLGMSGGLVFVFMIMVNLGDEVIIFDLCFVMYELLIYFVGGVFVWISIYLMFVIDLVVVVVVIMLCIKVIIVNSLGNLMGV